MNFSVDSQGHNYPDFAGMRYNNSNSIPHPLLRVLVKAETTRAALPYVQLGLAKWKRHYIMANKQYRVAIIGAGTIVQWGHIPNFQSLPNVSVEAICDVNYGLAHKNMAQFLGLQEILHSFTESD